MRNVYREAFTVYKLMHLLIVLAQAMCVFARVRKIKIIIISGRSYYVLPGDTVEDDDPCIIFAWTPASTTMFSGVVDIEEPIE